MSAQHCVLLLGGTGRTGGQVLTQLLRRGVPVRAIVRSAERLPEGTAGDPLLEVVEADPLSLSAEQLQGHLAGCDTVVSCLGHRTTLRGIFGPPYSIVTSAVSNLAQAVEAMEPAEPVRFILMSSVSVNRPANADSRRGIAERLVIGVLRGLVPPARDNQNAADYCAGAIGPDSRYVEWVVVRPDTLREGDAGDYSVHDGLVSTIFRPDDTNMANVADFMCELTTDDTSWARWRGEMPVVVNTQTAA